MEQNLLILGSSSYCRVVAETAREMGEWQKIDCLDDDQEDKLALEDSEYTSRYHYAFPAVEDSKLRVVLMRALEKAGYTVPSIIHPSAVVSSTATVEKGSAILAGAVISSGAEVGPCCMVGIGALMECNSRLEQGAQLCAGAIAKENTDVPEMAIIRQGKIYAR